MAEALLHKPEIFVTGANIQSNWSRQATAAAVKQGVPIVLMLRNTDTTEIQGMFCWTCGWARMFILWMSPT